MNRTKRKKGFGILEVLLSGIIIIIVVGSLVFLAKNALNNSEYLQEKAQAIFLAQEGIEIVRNIRDSNYIDGDNVTKWNYLVQDVSGNPQLPIENVQYFPSFNSNGKYKLISGIPPAITLDNIKFTREISFILDEKELLDENLDLKENALVVIVTVAWESSYKDGEVIIKELITNSRQGL